MGKMKSAGATCCQKFGPNQEKNREKEPDKEGGGSSLQENQ
jgi:hypothetical protein